MARTQSSLSPLVASAATIDLSAPSYGGVISGTFDAYVGGEAWQKECFRHYRVCGEARYAARYLARSVGRATLHSKDPHVRGLLRHLFAASGSGSQFLERIALQLVVAGEGFLIGREPQPHDIKQNPALKAKKEIWEVVSVSEITNIGGRLAINYNTPNALLSTDRVPIMLKPSDAVIRVWTADPEFQFEADSPFKSMLPVLGEIEDATKRIRAQAQSRLTGNGILMLPQGIEFPTEPGAKDPNSAGAFLKMLSQTASTALKNPESASARLPIVTMVPDELLGKAEWMTFWSELDAETVSNRGDAIRRFALGMDLPPEQVLGMGGQTGGQGSGTNHWNVWAIEEDTIKMFIEPMLDSITSSINSHYIAANVPDPGAENARCDYDTRALRLRPDRSKEAIELYDRGELSGETMRDENGFDEDQKPTDDERAKFLLWQLARGSANPAQIQSALSQLGVDLPDVVIADEPPAPRRPGVNNDSGVVPNTNPSIADHEVRDEPQALTASVSTNNEALMIACEAVVFRMLEKAGAKLIRAHNGRRATITDLEPMEAHLSLRPTDSMTVDKLLADHGQFAIATLSLITDQPAETASCLATYVHGLISNADEHRREKMIGHIQEVL